MAGRLIANDKVDTYVKFMEDLGAEIIRVSPLKNRPESWVYMTLPDLFGLQVTLANEQEQKLAESRACSP